MLLAMCLHSGENCTVKNNSHAYAPEQYSGFIHHGNRSPSCELRNDYIMIFIMCVVLIISFILLGGQAKASASYISHSFLSRNPCKFPIFSMQCSCNMFHIVHVCTLTVVSSQHLPEITKIFIYNFKKLVSNKEVSCTSQQVETISDMAAYMHVSISHRFDA